MKSAPLARSTLLAVALAAGPAFATARPGDAVALAASNERAVEKTAEGRVTAYTVGHEITVRMDDGRDLTVRLDEKSLDLKVPPDLAVGSRVRLVETRRVDGKRSVSVTVLAESPARP